MDGRSVTGHGAITVRARLALALMPVLLAASASASVHVFAISTYHSTDGRFSVTVPGGTMEETTFAGQGPMFEGVTVHALSNNAEGATLAVFYADASVAYLAATPIEKVLDDAAQANVATTNGTLASQATITIDGQPARDQRINGPRADYEFRLVVISNRLYSISVKGTADQVAAASARAFLDSFATDQ
jgi:hypothetical protein